MKRISVSAIQVGQRYAQAIFLASGQKLVPADRVVNDRHVQFLRRQAAADVFLADEFDRHHMDDDDLDAEATEQPEPAHDDADAELATGEWRASRIAESADLVKQFVVDTADHPLRTHPQELEIWDVHRPSGEPWPDADGLSGIRAELVRRLDGLYARLGSGSPVRFDEFLDIVRTLERLLIDHRQRFTQLALMVERRDEYLPDHAMSACLFAMATAAQLTWGLDDVRLAGAAALLHDTGMLLVPERIRYGGEQLSDADRDRVRRHPSYSLALIESVSDVPTPVKLAAFQHHERENGAGYPMQLRGEDIADLSRVVAVADVFSALSSPRNYRRHRLPYTAMEQLVRDAGAHQFFKPAARALVQAAGLFPVGSYVMLTSGRSARIMAANPNHLDRPTIALIDDDGRASEQSVDLSTVPRETLAVDRPIESPADSLEAA